MRHLWAVLRRVGSHEIQQALYCLRTGNYNSLCAKIKRRLSGYSSTMEDIRIFPYQLSAGEKISFECSLSPLVSIVVPVHNQWNYTVSCLNAIKEHTRGIDYEVILADDASEDETAHAGRYTDNLVVLRNKTSLGFLRNCNKAAQSARGKYLVILNNDTNVQTGWLHPMLALMESNGEIGLTGPKLIFKNGRIQEAGGIVWNDGSAWNYGRGEYADRPEYNYVKDVDYISGACILIRTEVWRKVGGFDEDYAPAYYEDTDFAFRLRKKGFRVVYQPRSVVVHFEGKSHGTSTGNGIKSYQKINQAKFVAKWKDVLQSEHSARQRDFFRARDRSRNRKTMLVIDHYVPMPDNDAGSVSVFHYLKLFVRMGFNVKFLGDNFYESRPYTENLQQMGIEVLCGSWYASHYEEWLKNNGRCIDYVFLNRPHIAVKHMDLLRTHTSARILYFGHDIHFIREQREYAVLKQPAVLKSALRWEAIETVLFRKADVVYYPSQMEVDEVKKIMPDVRVRAIPLCIFDGHMDHIAPFDAGRMDILFVGGFVHRPNVDAVEWFAAEIFPEVALVLPRIRCYIVGSNPPPSIRNLDSQQLIVTGQISDAELEKYYNGCRLAIAPLRYGAGIKGKIVAAMYHGLPVVCTPIGAEGLTGADALTIADSADEFARKIISLYQDMDALQQKSESSVDYIARMFSFEKARSIIADDTINDSHGSKIISSLS